MQLLNCYCSVVSTSLIYTQSKECNGGKTQRTYPVWLCPKWHPIPYIEHYWSKAHRTLVNRVPFGCSHELDWIPAPSLRHTQVIIPYTHTHAHTLPLMGEPRTWGQCYGNILIKIKQRPMAKLQCTLTVYATTIMTWNQWKETKCSIMWILTMRSPCTWKAGWIAIGVAHKAIF